MEIKNLVQGYYEVGNSFMARGIKQFESKIDALVYATKSNDFVRWNFHDSIWKNSTNTINANLKYLYKLRAEQLRDNYDYLILNYSGGMDSWTILNTFLSNDIFSFPL